MLPQVWILKNPDSRLVMSAAPMIFLSPQKILAKRTKKTKKNAIIRSISPEFRIHASQHIHKNMSGKSRLPKKVTPKYPDPSKHSYFENQQRLLKPSFITRFYWRVICDHQWSFKRNWRKKTDPFGVLPNLSTNHLEISESDHHSPQPSGSMHQKHIFDVISKLTSTRNKDRCKKLKQKSGYDKNTRFFCDVMFVMSISSPKEIDSKITSMILRI